MKKKKKNTPHNGYPRMHTLTQLFQGKTDCYYSVSIQ